MILVTGAAGNLGQLVIEKLLERLPASEIIATVRDLKRSEKLIPGGVQVREADYSRPETLIRAFEGAKKILLISSNELGIRVQQHQAVVSAARVKDVQLLVYTSILKADTSKLLLAKEHQTTETDIRASGLAFTFLRNGWYTENHTMSLPMAVEQGAIVGASKNGRWASASRADYAAAAVEVLTGSGHTNKTYELGGDFSYDLDELAAEASRQTNKTVAYVDMPEPEYAGALASFGLPQALAAAIADANVGARDGALDTSSTQLRDLIQRPTTSMRDSLIAALSGSQSANPRA